jgi:Ser/Thr protein kinase RdoA (MazF antagonist)
MILALILAAAVLLAGVVYGIPALQQHARGRKAAARELQRRQEWNAEVVRYASHFPGFRDPRRRGAMIEMADRHLSESLRELQAREKARRGG